MAEKKSKKKGPVRTEAVVPLLVIFGLIALYFTLFFDWQLRKAFEWGATYGNGAEVNVGYLHTSFLHGTFEMGAIQVTDPAEPEKNRFSVGRVNLGFLWDALLRGKVVIPSAGITNIAVGTHRDHPGRVLPPEPPGMISTAAAAMWRTAREKAMKSSPLADFSQFLQGFDPSKELKELKNLKSVAKIHELSQQLAQNEQVWNQTLNSIPTQADFDRLQSELGGMKVGGTSNPLELKKQADEIQKVVSELKGKMKAVEYGANGLTSEMSNFSKSVGQVDDLMKEDMKEAESGLKLPSLNPKDLAQGLFGDSVLAKAEQAQKYADLAHKYMPPKAAGKPNPEPAPRPRSTGRVFEFGKPHGYPAFWLQKAEISSKLDDSNEAGLLSGEIRDAASNQAQVGRPMVMELKGEFPRARVNGIQLMATLDHRSERAVDTVRASVASFPIAGRDLSHSGDVSFGFSKASGSGSVEGTYSEGVMRLVATSQFHDLDFQIKAKSGPLESTLKDVAKELKTVTVKATAEGAPPKLRMDIESNLADAITRGLQHQLQAKLDEAHKRIQAMLDQQVNGPKRELTSKMDAVKSKIFGEVDARKKKATSVQGTADQKLASTKGGATSGAKNKAASNLKKKLKL